MTKMIDSKVNFVAFRRFHFHFGWNGDSGVIDEDVYAWEFFQENSGTLLYRF